jgi:hypothetical protein
MAPAQPTPIPLPLASYQLADLRAGSKRLIGCYPEPAPQTEPDDTRTSGAPYMPGTTEFQQPAVLRRWPGLSTFTPSGLANPLRGMWEMAGTVYAVVGFDLFTVSAIGAFTLVPGSNSGITGTGFVRMTDNQACLVILVPGTDTCFTYTPFAGGGGFQQLTSSFFLALGGAIDVWYVDTFIVFLANNNAGNGSFTFFNDDGRQVSGNAQITFTTAASFNRQFGTDPFYGMCVDHREILMFGSRSTEGFVNTGNPTGSPFSAASDTYMPYGVHPQCPFSISLQDNSVMWVCNDLTVRRRNGQTPVRISTAGIEAVLSNANKQGLLPGTYSLASPAGGPTWNGHPFYILTIPLAERTLVYDCVTQQWFDLVSVLNGSEIQYRGLSYLNAFGKQLIGDSESGTIGFLDDTVQNEFGNPNAPTICAFTTQPLYNGNNRQTVRRVEAVVTAGAGPTPSVAPRIDLLLSSNWGQTFDESGDDSQTLGVPGDTDSRAIWWNLGQYYSLVMQFRVTDASPTFTVDVTAMVEPCKW